MVLLEISLSESYYRVYEIYFASKHDIKHIRGKIIVEKIILYTSRET